MTDATKRGNATRRNGDELTAMGPGGVFDVRPYWLDNTGSGDVESWPMYAVPMGPANGLPRDGFAVYKRVPGDFPGMTEHRHQADYETDTDAIRYAEKAAGKAIITLGPRESVIVKAGGEHGPENVVTIDEWGGVEIVCEYQRVKVDSMDPGPGGIQIFIDGPHVDGRP